MLQVAKENQAKLLKSSKKKNFEIKKKESKSQRPKLLRLQSNDVDKFRQPSSPICGKVQNDGSALTLISL